MIEKTIKSPSFDQVRQALDVISSEEKARFTELETDLLNIDREITTMSTAGTPTLREAEPLINLLEKLRRSFKEVKRHLSLEAQKVIDIYAGDVYKYRQAVIDKEEEKNRREAQEQWRKTIKH